MLHSLLLLLSLLSPHGTTPAQLSDWTAHPLIAHALGGIGGKDLTNSREAFETNYARGFRVFETDLMLTDDRKELVARHDWEKKQFVKFGQDPYIPTLKDWNPLPLQEFLELPINNRYTSMALPDLLNLLVSHPDAFLVLDTKFTDESTIRTQYRILVEEAEQIDPSLLNRIIPQLYNRGMLATIESVHAFPSYIYTLYQSKDTNKQVVDFVKGNPGIRGVAMPESRAAKAFVQSLNQAGARVYVHTVNDKRKFEKLRKIGVFGIYTDFIGYSDITEGLKGKWTAQPPLAEQ